ncbi:hypothetical protein AB6805_14785 [Chitinophaga sp. RCC_12]|uniref:hypothetical protein n=1 Tax=Chitinophaga sp. RCC_12 TaxID=3239226 RepID=UPI00352531A1
MFEQKFLAYILYSTFVEFRAKGVELDDKPLYWLSHLLHNVPFSLSDEYSSKEEYERLVKDVHTFNFDKWLEAKKEDFFISFPEYLPENPRE